MSRILAIDYGKKRTGLAVTDPMKLIATGLATVETPALLSWLKSYTAKEAVELFVVGEPKNLDGSDTDATALADQCARMLQKHFPQIPVRRVDERFTSRMAVRSMIDSGMKKKDRRNKALIDEISATLILQHYLESI